MKKSRELEKIIKGFASHRRIDILMLLHRKPGLSVGDIADELKLDFQNAAQHTSKLFAAGLLSKHRDLNMVRHRATPLGKDILQFLNQL